MPLALGDEARTEATEPHVPAVVLEARENVAEINELALEEAPPAVGSSCGETLDVEGIGPTCVTPDGQLRVEANDGRSATIHGLDAPPIAAEAYTPQSQARIQGAGAGDIACGTQSDPGYVLVYARPGNASSRYNEVASQMRAEAYKMSAFLDAESQAVDPAKGKRIRFQCTGGAPTVLNATLPSLSASGVAFSDVVNGLRALGYEYSGGGTGLQRYIIFIDAPSTSGAAGTGHIFAPDTTASANNANNRGGLYAVEYKWNGGGGGPHWNIMLHETGHTMGAVVDSAPNTSGSGHCNDGQDVMCYDDGGSKSNYSSTTCVRTLFDCNRDDYYNPSPAAGSYLATHWNAAATYNRWLEHRGVGDQTAPTQVTGITQTGASNSAAGIAWSPSTDNSGAVSYVVSARSGSDWFTVVTTSRRSATVSQLEANQQYEIGVAAVDAAGNTSTRTVFTVTTNDQPDTSAPAAPTDVTHRIDSKSLTISWNDAGDNVGVAAFELRRLDPAARLPRSAGSTPDTSITVPVAGLKPGGTYRFEVLARDDADNTSTAAVRTVVIPKDRVKPVASKRFVVTRRSATSLQIAWNKATDNVGVAQYWLYQKVGKRWVRIKALRANQQLINVTRLRPRTAYAFRLVARDAAGNLSAPRAVSTRTK